MSDTEQKPEIKPEKVMVIVRHEDKEIKIAVKRHHPMRKVFDAAGKAFAMDPNTLRFVCEGKRVNPEDTVETLDLEDGDEISAFLEQVGGGLRS